MKSYELDPSGFITQYLISGLKEEDFINSETDENQLRYEKHLRAILGQPQNKKPEGEIRLGENSDLGLPWSYYYNYGNWFVDLSTFYSVLTRVEMDACTQLVAEEDMTVKAIVWSYACVDVWCGEEHVCAIPTPVYKPIQKLEVDFHLREGANLLYIRLQTLGVRDTRTLFGIQILDCDGNIRITLPDEKHTAPVIERGRWLSDAVIREGSVCFPSSASEGTLLGYDSMSPDYAEAEAKVIYQNISGIERQPLKAGEPYIVVKTTVNGQTLLRQMENVAGIVPKKNLILDFEKNKMEIFKRTAAVESLSRGGKFGFSISNILARKATGQITPRDRELFLDTLQQIENRYDCSDFLVCGLVRYLKNYELDEELKERVKQVLLNYRFWMDQKGSDAMCFWSENHSLMFYVSAMNVGELYPEEFFFRAEMTGKELYETGKKRVEQWLDDVEEHGFEEFLSTVYMCVTFAGLLNTIDYTTAEISLRARKVTDRLLEMLAMHTYKGSVIAPMGRVYRQIIYPFLQGAQALMNLVNPEVPYSYGEGWLAFYATSTYKIPDGLIEKMQADILTEYETGNAMIRLEKNESYCLTSVQSPRSDSGFARWENLTVVEETMPVNKKTHEYTKSLNERFHGTTCFEPGVYGYQQHMWSAALDSETQVFANHPGGTCDSSQMRPGYWYGNGVMPAIRQEKGMLCAIYVIPEEHPIHFTHIFWPEVKFDMVEKEQYWLFGKKGSGYIGMWCSEKLQVHQDQVFDCEYRSYGDEIAYYCVCGEEKQYESMESFKEYCKAQQPIYQKDKKELRTVSMNLVYVKKEDLTQYI